MGVIVKITNTSVQTLSCHCRESKRNYYYFFVLFVIGFFAKEVGCRYEVLWHEVMTQWLIRVIILKWSKICNYETITIHK